MGTKAMLWTVITIVSLVFQYLAGLVFGGGLLSLWPNVFGVIGCFVGIWLWYKFMRNL